MPISSLLWGTNFENVVTIGYPIYSVLSDREERDGSMHIQGPSGQEDSWIVGRDYVMDAEVRWIPDGPNTNPVQTQLSGPVSWQEFLDWARDANSFRFVPDASVPDFYVDNVYLVEPRKGFGSLSADIKRNVKIKLRNATQDFHQALRGLMFEYAPGTSLTDPNLATFARSGAVGPFVGRNGLAGNAIANVLRDRHYPLLPQGAATRVTLLERGGPNIIENSDCEADVVGWGILQGTETLVRDNAQAFNGAWAAKVTVINTSPSGTYWFPRAGGRFAATAGTTYTTSVWVYAPAASVGKTMQMQIDWWNSVPASFQSTLSTAVALVAGWQRYTLTFTAPATTVTAIPRFQTSANQGVFTVWCDVPQFEVGAFATSAIPTGTGAVTRNTDGPFTYPWSWKPQALWFYGKFVELGTSLAPGGQFPPLVRITDAGQSWRQLIYGPGAQLGWTIVQNAAGGTQNDTTITAGNKPAVGDVVEILGLFKADTSVEIHQVRNGGAELSTVGTPVSPGFPAQYGATPTIDFTPDTAYGAHGLISVKVGPGTVVNTTARARAA